MQQGGEDQHIISQVLQGRTDAYALLVSRYQDYVFSLALKYIPNREEAEEAAQDVFIKAYKALASFRAASKFSTWLYTIVHNTCISRLRTVRREVVYMDDEMLLRSVPPNSNHSMDMINRKSKATMLEMAIGKLNVEEATMITLFYTAEQTLEEIGVIMGISANNAKVKLHRARQKLRDTLVKYFPEELQDFNYLNSNL